MPTAYFYGRVSTVDQAENGHSLSDQKIRLKRLYRTMLKRKGFTRGPLLRDRGVSAYKYPLFLRGDGQKLQMKSLSPAGMLEPGDCVVVDRLDRAFRSSRDFANTLHYWETNNVRVIFREFATGGLPRIYERMLLQMLASFAELDSAIKAERIRERNAIARLSGQPMGNTPLGFRIQEPKKKGGNRKVVPDWHVRGVMALMLKLSEQGLSHAEIKKEVLRAHARHVAAMRPKLLTARDIEVLDTIAACEGSVTRAARSLGLNKSTVKGVQIKARVKLPKAPFSAGLDVSKVSKWLTAARKFRDAGELFNPKASSDV